MDSADGTPEANTGIEKENPAGGMSQKECMERISKGLKHPTVKFIREHMEKAGCPFWVRLILAANCKRQGLAGGYSSRNGIQVCCNHMTYQDEINQVLIHELIHAYDDCRAKNMDWKNCAHHACSEIRANHLSGDCHYKRELLRGFMKIRGHEQDLAARMTIRSRHERGGMYYLDDTASLTGLLQISMMTLYNGISVLVIPRYLSFGMCEEEIAEVSQK